MNDWIPNNSFGLKFYYNNATPFKDYCCYHKHFSVLIIYKIIICINQFVGNVKVCSRIKNREDVLSSHHAP